MRSKKLILQAFLFSTILNVFPSCAVYSSTQKPFSLEGTGGPEEGEQASFSLPAAPQLQGPSVVEEEIPMQNRAPARESIQEPVSSQTHLQRSSPWDREVQRITEENRKIWNRVYGNHHISRIIHSFLDAGSLFDLSRGLLPGRQPPFLRRLYILDALLQRTVYGTRHPEAENQKKPVDETADIRLEDLLSLLNESAFEGSSLVLTTPNHRGMSAQRKLFSPLEQARVLNFLCS